MNPVVFDSSAILVALNAEPGSEKLTPAVVDAAISSTVNLAEVQTKLVGLGMDPAEAPGVLVRSHGPFAWGKTATKAAQNAVLLEEIAAIAYQTVVLNAEAAAIPAALHDRHFLRKHGANATYGQTVSK